MTQEEAGTPTSVSIGDWLSVLDELDVQFLILDTHDDEDLFQIVRTRPEWILDFQEGNKVLFAHTPVARSSERPLQGKDSAADRSEGRLLHRRGPAWRPSTA